MNVQATKNVHWVDPRPAQIDMQIDLQEINLIFHALILQQLHLGAGFRYTSITIKAYSASKE